MSLVAAGQSYPDGFNEEVAFDNLEAPVKFLPVSEEISFIVGLYGRIWVVRDGVVDEVPILDISEEVGRYHDLGLISAALDPEFSANGYIYLLYTVDRHHLFYFGTPDYDPEASDYNNGGIGRVTRFTVDTEEFDGIIEGSRHVVLGQGINDGIPISAGVHGLGEVLFGEDGSLLISTGDSNTPWCCYNGEGQQLKAAYDSTNYYDGILGEDEFVGAFRSQYVDGLNGKIIRIHPETGEGLAGNPFFDESAPNIPRSMIWSLGLRNPFRLTIQPGSGWGNLESGHPGTIFLSDVGQGDWEELNRVDNGGQNFGWPIYEGLTQYDGYANLITMNRNAPNPEFGQPGCDHESFTFQELLVQENHFQNYSWENPCTGNQIESTAPTFYHSRPILAYRNTSPNEDAAVIPTFDASGNATVTAIDDQSVQLGEPFRGNSGNGGTFIYGNSIPEEYHGSLILSDYTGWIREIKFDENNEISNIELWREDIGTAVDIVQNPYDGCIYLTTLGPGRVTRICFGGNLKPIIDLEQDTIYGVSPFVVDFDASKSYDPEGESITFSWNFGDQSPNASGPAQTHTYVAEQNSKTSFETILKVEDESGAFAEKKIWVSLNNTPPEAQISSIEEGELYSLEQPTLFDLVATVQDLEHSPSEMNYDWEYRLRHNTHYHVLDVFEGNFQSAVVSPTPCDEEDYWYEIVLKVTDPGGLISTTSRQVYPDCAGELKLADVNEIVLYPNPTTNGTIRVYRPSGFDSNVSYLIYSISGHLVSSDIIQVYNERLYFDIDLENIESGLYVIELLSGGEKSQLKFVVDNSN